MDNFELINEKLAEVKRLGISVAFDQFRYRFLPSQGFDP